MKTWSGNVVGLVGLMGIVGCGSTAAPTGSSSGPEPEPAACKPEAAQGIEVSSTDVYQSTPYALGYPPYAIDGCTLVYVARPAEGSESGELRVRELSTGNERVAAQASEEPRRPSVAGSVIVWEATIAGKSVIRVQRGGEVVTMEGAFDHASEPRAAADAIVFTAWLGPGKDADTDVLLYEPASKELTTLGTGPGQQRFADVSETHVAWSDFIEDPDGIFDENPFDMADLVVHDRASGKSETRSREGKQAFPLLGAPGKIAYLDWNLVHPEPKLTAYDLRLGDIGAPIESDVLVENVKTFEPYLRPVARGALLEWVAWPHGTATLFRRPVDLSREAEELAGFEEANVFGPTASEVLTLLGARTGAGPVTLQAFAR